MVLSCWRKQSEDDSKVPKLRTQGGDKRIKTQIFYWYSLRQARNARLLALMTALEAALRASTVVRESSLKVAKDNWIGT